MNFWHLTSDPLQNDFAQVVDNQWESVNCPLNPGHKRAGRRIGNLKISLSNGSTDDFIWTWSNDCIIQSHVLKLFRDQQLTGLSANPVQVFNNDCTFKYKPLLYEVQRLGWAGIVLPESGIRLVERCSACAYIKYSGSIDNKYLMTQRQWDGSDFFMLWPLPRFIFVTDRVADLIIAKSISGVIVEPIENIKFKNSGFVPGALRNWMPNDRAKKLGEPLGIY